MNPPLHVLMVEDSEDDVSLVLEILNSTYTVTYRREESEAGMRKALAEEQWDLILCDYCMPQFDAPSALKVLQSLDLKIPFIIVSGTVGEETAVEVLKLGADDYLLKDKLVRLLPAIERSLHEMEAHRYHEISENKIREQSKLLDKAQDAIIVTDLEGHIQYWNKGAQRVYGWTASEALSQKSKDFLANINQGNLIEKAFARVLEKGDWSGELYDHTKEGRPLTIQSSWTLLRDDEGKPKSVLAINTDVTEKKNLEAQVMHAQRLESIGTLTSGIAHDFNNYLTIINCAAEVRLMELPSGDSVERDTLQSIHDAGRRAANLTSQLLAFSRKSAMQVSTLDLNSIISGLENLLKRMVGADIEIQMELDAEPGFIHSDPVHIEQIVLNLAINARDAMDGKGTLRIQTSHRRIEADQSSKYPGAEPGAYLLLAVSDNGSGMTEETKARIFEPFFTTKEQGKGTGLGLSTVYGIVKQNQGIIFLKSEVGKGTTFEILLPETTAEGSVVPLIPQVQPGMPARQKTVVLADDNISLRGITKMVLETQGFNVLESSHGKEALAHIVNDPNGVNVILSDITMPGMNSSDFIEEVKKLRPDLPILFMSGNPNHAFLERYLAETGLPFLQKPFTTQNLYLKLRETLDKAEKA